MKRDNEKLNQTVMSLRREIEEQAKVSTNLVSFEGYFMSSKSGLLIWQRSAVQNNESFSWEKERKAFEKKISELEEENKKMETIRQDNLRLKEENAALIRVISKLSK